MRIVNMTEQLNAMQLLFLPTFNLSQAMSRNACGFWENQEKSLNSVQSFANGWFERRHTGIRAAAEAAERMCKAETPVDLFREYHDWTSGVFQRVMIDGSACQQQFMTVAGTVVPPLAGEKEEALSQTGMRPAVHSTAA